MKYPANKIVFPMIVCIISILLAGCSRSGGGGSSRAQQLPSPANMRVTVTGRLVNVSWDAVENARGYIINMSSPGCASGNRIINTATRTVTGHDGTVTPSAAASQGITNRGNGFVTFTGPTSFTLWLMAGSSETEAMANSINAAIMAVGDGNNYSMSPPSAIVSVNRAGYR